MTTYEILLLLDPENAEAHQEELVTRVRGLVESGGGTWRSHDAWGRRRLAYEIAKKSEGVYHLVVFESSAETLDEVVRVLKIDDVVLRQLATRHVEGSRTSAPREDAAPAPAVAVPDAIPEAVLEAVPDAVVPDVVPDAEYAETNVRSDEEV